MRRARAVREHRVRRPPRAERGSCGARAVRGRRIRRPPRRADGPPQTKARLCGIAAKARFRPPARDKFKTEKRRAPALCRRPFGFLLQFSPVPRGGCPRVARAGAGHSPVRCSTGIYGRRGATAW